MMYLIVSELLMELNESKSEWDANRNETFQERLKLTDLQETVNEK